jgi:hypothetical protein
LAAISAKLSVVFSTRWRTAATVTSL